MLTIMEVKLKRKFHGASKVENPASPVLGAHQEFVIISTSTVQRTHAKIYSVYNFLHAFAITQVELVLKVVSKSKSDHDKAVIVPPAGLSC